MKKTLQGEDTGVMIDGAGVAFRPVKVYSEDYATQEYGVTAEELDRFVRKAGQELDADRKSGRPKQFTSGCGAVSWNYSDGGGGGGI
jgi:hypothetical protein